MKQVTLTVTAAFLLLLLTSVVPAAENVQTYLDRGIDRCERGQYDEAIQDFNQALKLKANDANIYECLGIAYYAKGNNDRAIQYLTQAVTIDPRHARAFTRRANIYDTKGEYDQALADLEQAKKLGYKVDTDFIRLIQRKAAAKKK